MTTSGRSGVAYAVAMTLMTSTALADGLESPDDALTEIVVLAQRATAEVGRAAQEQAPNLINVMTDDEIVRLPDVNTGEAIRRVPGISLETDTGEGRYVNIRGLDADLNSTTFGGLRLPPTNTSSPSGAGRAVAFDSIPIGFIGAITVTKSNLPEQDAEALGGTIDITPKTAPRDGKPFIDVRLGTGEELQRHTGISDFAVTTGGRFGGANGDYQPFSILLTGSIYNDGRGIDDEEAGFYDEQPAVPDKAISALEQRYYQYHRRRHGYGADLGFDPTEEHHYFVRYYDAGYTEYKFRQMLQWNFTDPSGTAGVVVPPAGNPNALVGPTDNIRVNVQDEKETLTQRVFEIGGVDKFEGNTLDYHVGYTRAATTSRTITISNSTTRICRAPFTTIRPARTGRRLPRSRRRTSIPSIPLATHSRACQVATPTSRTTNGPSAPTWRYRRISPAGPTSRSSLVSTHGCARRPAPRIPRVFPWAQILETPRPRA